MNNLDSIIQKAARTAAAGSRYEVDELVAEAWIYTHDPVRARTIQHHVENTFQDADHRMTVGETRLLHIVGKYLDDWTREQDGLPPRGAQRSTYGDGAQAVQIHHASRRTYWDGEDEWAEPTLDEAFPATDAEWVRGYSVEHVEPEAGDWEPLQGRYGFAQAFPFGIIAHAMDLGVISRHQADLLEYLMDGDSASDLACRFPEEAKGSIQSSVSQALKALRKEPKLQEWAQSLGFNPLAPKGERWCSEHRHDDGRPAGPAPARPFVCTCLRGQDTYTEDAMDQSDPLRVLLSA